ncbi:MAG TPA: hypothetical protein VLH60_07145, partial [Sedimentisphaerales bacterium]|nr:hypothetical protein [Sedimentisphaerales bacterium]
KRVIVFVRRRDGISKAAVAAVACQVWFLIILSRMGKLLIRIPDMLSEMSVEISRLEQSSAGGSVIAGIRQPGLNIESIPSDEKDPGNRQKVQAGRPSDIAARQDSGAF